MRNLNKLSLLILVFACPVFVWAQTKRERFRKINSSPMDKVEFSF